MVLIIIIKITTKMTPIIKILRSRYNFKFFSDASVIVFDRTQNRVCFYNNSTV